MASKRFYAADMHTAMNSIRAEMGEEAIILSTRKLADGVEVNASMMSDSDSSSEGGRSNAGQGSSAFRENKTSAATRSTAKNTLAEKPWYLNSISGFEEEHSALHKELGGITSLLQNWMDKQGWDNFSTKSPVSAKLWQRYSDMGFSGSQLQDLLRDVNVNQEIKSAWQQSLSLLAARLPILEGDLLEDGGIFAFVGSAGVGKTTTIGKLATQFVLKHGADSVALITTDRYRIAAHEQLRTFAKILGVSVQAVDENNSIDDLLSALRHKKLVLIDTAGIGVRHSHFDEQLERLSVVKNNINPVLVISSTAQSEVIAAELAAYKSVSPVAAVLSKTDEAIRLGECLGLLIEARCPIAYVAEGQSIPEDISRAHADKIINQAVTASRRKPVEKEQMIAGFGAVYSDPQQSIHERRQIGF